jgi:hypothetical protein
MYDPLQSYQQTSSPFAGGATPFGLPYGNQPIATSYPQFAGNPLAGIQAGGYGIHPLQHLQQLQQLMQIQQLQQQLQQLHQLQNPLTQGLQNPILQGLQNPLTQGWQNPMLQGLQNPFSQGLQHPLLHALQNPFQQGQYNPLQFQNPMIGYQPWTQQFGYPLAPQSLIGGGQGFGQGYGQGIGQGFGQIHPLAAQLALRSAGAGISPWGC